MEVTIEMKNFSEFEFLGARLDPFKATDLYLRYVIVSRTTGAAAVLRTTELFDLADVTAVRTESLHIGIFPDDLYTLRVELWRRASDILLDVMEIDFEKMVGALPAAVWVPQTFALFVTVIDLAGELVDAAVVTIRDFYTGEVVFSGTGGEGVEVSLEKGRYVVVAELDGEVVEEEIWLDSDATLNLMLPMRAHVVVFPIEYYYGLAVLILVVGVFALPTLMAKIAEERRKERRRKKAWRKAKRW